mmetsp:Transcript_81736/g.264853  ORF Transcript_81736/g.264853 Transcript_81736/m.264853 type:complete len:334 (+) Transcript_81736:102-1103(+)
MQLVLDRAASALTASRSASGRKSNKSAEMSKECNARCNGAEARLLPSRRHPGGGACGKCTVVQCVGLQRSCRFPMHCLWLLTTSLQRVAARCHQSLASCASNSNTEDAEGAEGAALAALVASAALAASVSTGGAFAASASASDASEAVGATGCNAMDENLGFLTGMAAEAHLWCPPHSLVVAGAAAATTAEAFAQSTSGSATVPTNLRCRPRGFLPQAAGAASATGSKHPRWLHRLSKSHSKAPSTVLFWRSAASTRSSGKPISNRGTAALTDAAESSKPPLDAAVSPCWSSHATASCGLPAGCGGLTFRADLAISHGATNPLDETRRGSATT